MNFVKILYCKIFSLMLIRDPSEDRYCVTDRHLVKAERRLIHITKIVTTKVVILLQLDLSITTSSHILAAIMQVPVSFQITGKSSQQTNAN